MTEEQYARLFIDLAYYRLPDGTEAQAIWTGSEPIDGDTLPPYWIIVPLDNPPAPAWRTQYEVQRGGAIVVARSAGELPPNTPLELPQVEFRQEGYSDLSVDDLELVVNPWEGLNQ